MSNAKPINNFIRINPEHPETWGSSFWITAHTVAAGYPKTPTSEEQNKFKEYFDTFEYILPCQECRENWKLVLEQRPLTEAALANRITLSRWVLDVHNLVNEKLGKKPYNWKYVTHRFQGIEETQPKIVKKITLTPESISGTSIIPDTSLGIVGLKTPSAWRNSMVHLNEPPKRAVRHVTPMVAIPRDMKNRKKCGCSK